MGTNRAGATSADVQLPKSLLTKQVESSTKERRVKEVLALGFKGADGTITVTDVLCTNWPEMTQQQMADLSWKLSQWAASYKSEGKDTRPPPDRDSSAILERPKPLRSEKQPETKQTRG